MNIEIICATRTSGEEFWARSALGQSLRRLSGDKPLILRLCASNTRGLPSVYNEGLSAASPENIVAFVHDDVWLDDYFVRQRLIEGLTRFDVLGIAGNRRRVARQPTWAFLDLQSTWDDPANLSGAVAHGAYPFGSIKWYGECPAECELLDGVFLAAKRQTLEDANVRFDARFDFHFYDLDFCRSARLAGLRLGTWPVSVTHQSGGAGIATTAWKNGYRAYLEKWGG